MRNDCLRAIDKLAGERHKLWNDYLACVKHIDQLQADNKALRQSLSLLVKMTEDGDLTTVELDEARALLKTATISSKLQ